MPKSWQIKSKLQFSPSLIVNLSYLYIYFPENMHLKKNLNYETTYELSKFHSYKYFKLQLHAINYRKQNSSNRKRREEENKRLSY